MSGKVSDVPGWGSSKDNKNELFENFSRALSNGDFEIRSAECLQECREIVRMEDRTIDHVRSRNSPDPSGARENHADRAMAAALCWHAMKSRVSSVTLEPEIPVGSLAWRREAEKKQKQEASFW